MGGANYVKPVELIIDLGERIVVLADVSMRAQASGVPLTEAYGVVLALKNGKVARIQEYFDHAEALKAVGLADGVGDVAGKRGASPAGVGQLLRARCRREELCEQAPQP